MSRGEAGARIHVLDENGKVLPGVFLPGEELWDPGFRRLTMTFDPGRIKRGLTSNEAMGPPIAEGKRYTLVIDRDWPDARGVTMVEGFRKTFRGGPAERNPPDPKQWRVTAPKAGTSEAAGGELPHADELRAAAADAAGFRARHGSVAGTVSVDGSRNRMALHAAGALEGGRLPTGGGHRASKTWREITSASPSISMCSSTSPSTSPRTLFPCPSALR